MFGKKIEKNIRFEAGWIRTLRFRVSNEYYKDRRRVKTFTLESHVNWNRLSMRQIKAEESKV